MVYVISSSPLPPQSMPVEEPASAAADEANMASLARRVSAYLARVVGALADFEDRLLTEDGFFAREEHFEAQIDSLRREFEGNRKAGVRASPNALALMRIRSTPSLLAARACTNRCRSQ